MSNYKMKEMNPFIRARQYAAELKEKRQDGNTVNKHTIIISLWILPSNA